MRIAICLAAFAVAACAPSSEPAKPVEQVKAEPAAEPPVFQPNSITFQPLSKSAEATGAVSFSAGPRPDPNALPRMKITGVKGMAYETELAPGTADEAKLDWKAIFGAEVVTTPNPPPFSPSVEIHAVVSQAGDVLCGADKTSHIAIGTRLVVDGKDVMNLAAFKGGVWPPKNNSDLCGVFSYTPPPPPS
jgi:hypothetical protein